MGARQAHGMPSQPPSQLGVGVDRSLEGVLADVFDNTLTAQQVGFVIPFKASPIGRESCTAFLARLQNCEQAG